MEVRSLTLFVVKKRCMEVHDDMYPYSPFGYGTVNRKRMNAPISCQANVDH